MTRHSGCWRWRCASSADEASYAPTRPQRARRAAATFSSGLPFNAGAGHQRLEQHVARAELGASCAPRRRHWQLIGNCTPTLPPLDEGMVPVTVWPTVSVSVTDMPPTAVPKSQ